MLAGSTLIYRKLSSPPQALRLRARLDTNGKKKIGAEFMTSVSYRPEVIRRDEGEPVRDIMESRDKIEEDVG